MLNIDTVKYHYCYEWKKPGTLWLFVKRHQSSTLNAGKGVRRRATVSQARFRDLRALVTI